MMGVNDYMQHSDNNMSNERQVYRTPGLQATHTPKRKLFLLGACVLLVGLVLGLFAMMSPTTPTSAASPSNPGLLSTNPTVLDNLGKNRACNYDTHGGAPYVYCTITLKNTSNRNSMKWSVSSSAKLDYSARSGKLAPNASVGVTFFENGLDCPARFTINFTGPFNVLKVPVICNDIVVTPNQYSFSSKSCSKDFRGNWTCMVRVSADRNDTEPVQWTAKVTTSSAAAAALKVFPSSGTVSIEKRGAVTIDRSQFVRISIPASWGCKAASIFIYSTGTPQISRPLNTLNWNCSRR
jgi:hypothetical protein